MGSFDYCDYSIVGTSTIHILLASSVPCIALSHLESWCKLRRCIQTLGMIRFVIINLIISFLKTTTILMTLNCRGSIVAFSINKSVEPNEEQKVLVSDFGKEITADRKRTRLNSSHGYI